MEPLTPTLDRLEDPRINEAYIRTCPATSDTHPVVLVGVVHDHPASIYRVRQLVAALQPEILALELPPLALPLFETYAGEGETPPSSGGEMSAAIQACTPDRIVGIDGPTIRFGGHLLARLYRERASLPTALSSLRALASVSKHAGICRLTATIMRWTSCSLEVDTTATFDTTLTDTPPAQADDECRQVRKAQFILQAFGASRAGQFRDETREAYMADNLVSLRETSPVLAIVGIDHLDPLEDRLTPDP